MNLPDHNVNWIDDALFEQARKIVPLVGYPNEDHLCRKDEHGDYVDPGTAHAYREWLCHDLLGYIWSSVEEWQEKHWSDYPAKVLDWHNRASEAEAAHYIARRARQM